MYDFSWDIFDDCKTKNTYAYVHVTKSVLHNGFHNITYYNSSYKD